MSVQTQIFILGLVPMFGAHGTKVMFFGGFCPLYYIFLNLRSFAHFWSPREISQNLSGAYAHFGAH
jgi:hypothetical protein